MATIAFKQPTSATVRFLGVKAGVRYWEDATVNGRPDDDGTLIPSRAGGTWSPTIDLDAGTVVDWPAGTTASIHYKVCDDGVYTLLSETGEQVRQIEGYVPQIMSPGKNGYGDYIIMEIDGAGSIADWRVTLEEFQENDDED